LLISELQVRRFLQEPDTLRRYWDATAWIRTGFIGREDQSRVFVPFNAVMTARAFSEAPKEEYWWWARNFVVLAYATGRDDLLKDVAADQLSDRCSTWFKWFKENLPYLRVGPHDRRWVLDETARKNGFALDVEHLLPNLPLPDVPFPDWKGPVPPPAHDLFFSYFYKPKQGGQ
jgi:hypothetical protein